MVMVAWMSLESMTKSAREDTSRSEEEDATRSIVVMMLCLMRLVPVVSASLDGLITVMLDSISFQANLDVLIAQNIKEFSEMTHGYAHQ
jgi:hypothetical protein